MKIIACCKVVHDELDITIGGNRELNTDNAGLKISLYDLNALEAAVNIAQAQSESQITALSLGNKTVLENSKIRKDILSRGVDALTLIADDTCDVLYPTDAASILAKAAEKIGFDLIICGEGSGDLYAQQTGLQIGEYLNIPTINGVSKITLQGDVVQVERVLEDAIEELEFTLPAVISVSSDINTPKLPSMKAILAANKKPVTQWTLSDIACSPTEATALRVSALAPEKTDRLGIILDDDSDDNITLLANHLRQIINS